MHHFYQLYFYLRIPGQAAAPAGVGPAAEALAPQEGAAAAAPVTQSVIALTVTL